MNLGAAISDGGDFERAMAPLSTALELCPDSVAAMQTIAMNLLRQGKWSEAIPYYERGLRLVPDNPELHRNLGFALLATGDCDRGWAEHEWRLLCTPHPGIHVNRPGWDGGEFPGRTILLHFEQGLGDTLQFIRYAPMVKARGSRVVVLCPQPLVRLLSRAAKGSTWPSTAPRSSPSARSTHP